MSLEQFDKAVVQGKKSHRTDPVEDVISLVLSLSPEDVARVQRAIADRVAMFTVTGNQGAARPKKDKTYAEASA